MQKQNERFAKTIITFLVAPAIPVIIFACMIVLAYTPRTVSGAIAGIGNFLFIGYLIASAHILLLGLPAFLVGLRLQAIRWWVCMIVGYVIGGLPMAIWMQGGWLVFVPWGTLGALGGFAFWLLWRFWIRWEPSVEA
jgi:hypothetical protein